jgi:hypothetical protein
MHGDVVFLEAGSSRDTTMLSFSSVTPEQLEAADLQQIS